MICNFRRAADSDIAVILPLYAARVKWMEEQGLRQWNTTDYLRVYSASYFQARAASGELYVAEMAGTDRIVGAVVLLRADDRWADSDTQNALYIHNLVTAIPEKGVGAAILQAIEALALAAGKSLLRLDCADDNTFLHDYYALHGYLAVGSCRDGLYHGILWEKKLS